MGVEILTCMRGEVPDTVREHARLQHGVVSRQQALAADMSPDSIQSKVEWGRWRRVLRGVYALDQGRLSREGTLWAAVLWAGEEAVLSHESAAEVQGILDKPAREVHITIPPGKHQRSVPGIRVHRSDRVLGLRERYPPGLLPATLPPDTVLDLTQTAKDPDEMCDWITRAFRKGKVSDLMLLAALRQRQKVRHRQDIIHLIGEAANGTHSPLEYRYDRDAERAHGLPRSRRQTPYRKEDGGKGFRDRCYEEYAVIVELDGRAYHEDPAADRRRDNHAAAADGSLTLRFGWREVRWHPCESAVTVAKVLRTRGWRDAPRPCGPSCPIAGQ